MSQPSSTPHADLDQTRLAKAALDEGLITQKQLHAALARQAELALESGGAPPPLGLVLLSKKFIKNLDLIRLHTLLNSGASVKPAAPSLGTFGKYSILRELGRGGTAVVYEAADTDLERPVALKVILPNPSIHPDQAAKDEKRFLLEAKLSASLPKHPHIVGVYEAGAIEGKRYIAMEIIRGKQMQEWWPTAPLRTRIALLAKVAHAVNHAHRHKIIHRDLKPANILVDQAGDPHVTDFGLGKALRPDAQNSLTGDFAVGTPHYMSPEQAQGLKSVDARTDVYSLGVLLYEALCDARPFDGETPMEIMMKALRRTAPAPSTVSKSKVPADLEAVCLKAMARDRRDRYPDARAFAIALETWLSKGEVTVAPPRSTRRLQPVKAKSPLKPLLLIGGAVLLLGIGLVALLSSGPSDPPAPAPTAPPEDTAERERLLAERRAAEERAARAEAKLNARAKPVTVRVSATQAWTPTGISLLPGEYLEISTRDRWTMKESGPQVGAAGDPAPSKREYAQKFPIPSAQCMALIARIGENGPVFLAPEGPALVSPAGGPLFLGPNDSRFLDNSGGLTVTVTRSFEPSSPAPTPPIRLNLSGFDSPKMKFLGLGKKMSIREKGAVSTRLSVPWSGRYRITFNADSELALGVGAEFVVRVDGRKIGQSILTTDRPRDYSLVAPLEAGSRRFEIDFINDLNKPQRKEDRNLFIHSITLARID